MRQGSLVERSLGEAPVPGYMSLPSRHGITTASLLRGSARNFARGKSSAIAKTEIEGRVRIGVSGLFGDEQGDLGLHGGPDKAIHHYPRDHYEAWRAELQDVTSSAQALDELLRVPGAFGENLSTLGMTEANTCVGDRWRLGTALIEVSQARQPCWKLNERFGVADMARRVQDSGRTGWYYRVREEGHAEAGDRMSLVDRPHPDWPLARLLHTLYIDCLDRASLEGMAALEELSMSWRTLARQRLERGSTESWADRLLGDHV